MATEVEEHNAVYTSVRADILAGVYPPASRIPLGKLCETHRVSLSVVREAVTRLASEKLITARPQRGFFTPDLSLEALRDLTDIRCEIESLALRGAIEHANLAWEARIVAAHHTLSRTPPWEDECVNPEWMIAHSHFHAELVSSCPNSLLIEIRQNLYDSAQLYRAWSAQPGDSRRTVGHEHSSIVKAALARDVVAATTLLREHIEHTTRSLVTRINTLNSKQLRSRSSN